MGWILAAVIAFSGLVAAREVWVHLDRDQIPGICHDIY
jgi:hypothetical protein